MLIPILALALVSTNADPVCTPQRPANTLAARASQYDSVSGKVGQAIIKICYGRPKMNGRKIFGSDLVPFGKLWRTGANEPTIIHTTAPIAIAGVKLAAGSYSLYLVPQATGPWDVVLNKSISQWGIESAYDEAVKAQEIAPRGKAMTKQLSAPTEVFTIALGNAELLFSWENTLVVVPIVSGN